MNTMSTKRDDAIRAEYRDQLDAAIQQAIVRKAREHAKYLVADALSDPDFIAMCENHEYCGPDRYSKAIQTIADARSLTSREVVNAIDGVVSR